MKNVIPAAIVALGIVLASLVQGRAQQQPGAFAAGPYAVDTIAFVDDYKIGVEVGTVLAGTIAGEPIAKSGPGKQQMRLEALFAARTAQGYRLIAWEEGFKLDLPSDGRYSTEEWTSYVRIVWGK